MRFGTLLLTVALALPLAANSQAMRRPRAVERFEVSGLPKSPTSELEKEIFLLLRIHKKGDLTDASRIHAKLGQFYRERGEGVLSDACNRMAMEAWEVASGERSPSAGSPGTPPFQTEKTLSRGFTYTDEALQVEHTWDFYDDGTFAHGVTVLSESDVPGLRELGWYRIVGGQVRLWQLKPRSDRTVSFELLGKVARTGQSSMAQE